MLTIKKLIFYLPAIVLLLAGCGPSTPGQGKPVVVASTTIIGDIVRQVGGEQIEVHTLLPLDSDPHGFSPAPQDVARVESAEIVFLNGFNLEESLADLIAANAQGKIVTVSDGVQALEVGDHTHNEAASSQPEAEGFVPDPHVWMDPANVQVWVKNIAQALSELDPGNAAVFQQNAAAYHTELEALDRWIQSRVATIPAEQRLLVTDHDTLGYFAKAYGFRVIGVVVVGGSTLSDPSAQQISALEKAIVEFEASAIFVDTTVNPQLSERIAMDTGASLVRLYTASLSVSDGPAATYLQLMKFNANAIAQAFGQ